MIHLEDYLYEAELNLEWWNSKSPAYQKRYLTRHPNSIYAKSVQSGEIEVGGNTSDPDEKEADEKQDPVKNNTISKFEKKKADLEDSIVKDEAKLNSLYPEHKKLLDEFLSLPNLIMRKWENGHWVYDNPEDEAIAERKEKLRGYLASSNAEIEVIKHRIDLAKRRIYKINREVNFEERQATPNATTKYSGSGIAEVVDFHGMDKETEEVALSAVEESVKRYPFMKGHLKFLGSHKSEKFKELTIQQAHDFYYDSIEKEYNKAKDYLAEALKGYLGDEKDPREVWRDSPTKWESTEQRDSLYHKLYTANEAYAKIKNIDSRGGIEGYLKTPTYQNAIKKWGKIGSRTWAYYRPNSLSNYESGMIAFNENSFDKADAKHCVDTRWHPEGCDTKKATMDHEFGHAIWFRLGLNKVDMTKRNLGDYDFAGRSPLQQYISEQMRWGKNHVKDNLSEYAATDSSEFFAEAYSEYLNNPNPREIARKVGELLDKEIEARGYKK